MLTVWTARVTALLLILHAGSAEASCRATSRWSTVGAIGLSSTAVGSLGLVALSGLERGNPGSRALGLVTLGGIGLSGAGGVGTIVGGMTERCTSDGLALVAGLGTGAAALGIPLGVATAYLLAPTLRGKGHPEDLVIGTGLLVIGAAMTVAGVAPLAVLKRELKAVRLAPAPNGVTLNARW